MYEIFTVLGYFGALLTAVYTFRLIFRVLPGKPCPEAQELIDTGHVHHAHPFNPATGEEEDSDVGFPGADHHIAEQSGPMRIAMGVLTYLALYASLVQVPGVDQTITKFLDPVFADSPLAAIHPRPRRRLGRPRRSARADLARRDRHRLLALRRSARRRRRRLIERLRPAPHLPRQQVVLRRG